MSYAKKLFKDKKKKNILKNTFKKKTKNTI